MGKFKVGVAAVLSMVMLSACSTDGGDEGGESGSQVSDQQGVGSGNDGSDWRALDIIPENGLLRLPPASEIPVQFQYIFQSGDIASQMALPFEGDESINQGLGRIDVEQATMVTSFMSPNQAQIVQDTGLVVGHYFVGASEHNLSDPQRKEAKHALLRFNTEEDAKSVVEQIAGEMATNGEQPIAQLPVPWAETPAENLGETRAFSAQPGPTRMGVPDDVNAGHRTHRTLTPIGEYVFWTETIALSDDPAWAEGYATKVIEKQRALVPEIESLKTEGGVGMYDELPDKEYAALELYNSQPLSHESQNEPQNFSPRGYAMNYENAKAVYEVLLDTKTEHIVQDGSVVFASADEQGAQKLQDFFVEELKAKGGTEYDEPQGIENTVCLESQGVDGDENTCVMRYGSAVVMTKQDNSVYSEVNNINPKKTLSELLATSYASFRLADELGIPLNSNRGDAREIFKANFDEDEHPLES
ncbi:hypothetical protein QP027_10025 [Corynebacterium breve]|uniref:Uncharacterized protein n=1 Tax=Corynebacterium breve TaxID=3049799 RepID=A0ABY8VGT5_9CORY|nr:hypothetical protein [Corynebacterium breve]WIM67429.1 hypothetical protein QP027_10025 [Corynebacterium breve]